MIEKYEFPANANKCTISKRSSENVDDVRRVGKRIVGNSILLGGLVWLLCGAMGCGFTPTVHAYDQAVLDSLSHLNLQTEIDPTGRVSVVLAESQDITAADLSRIFELTELRRLSLYDSRFPEEGLRDLANVGRLSALGIGKTEISDKALEHIAGASNLHWLWLWECEKITDDAVEKFRKARPDVEVYE